MQQYLCKVCGKPVDPEKDIAFTALGKPLFAAHANGCAAFVRGTSEELGKLGVTLLKARKPELYNGIVRGLTTAKRLLAALEPEPEK